MTNPWNTIKKNIIYRNRFGYTLRDDDVITPAGKEGNYMVLEGRGYVTIVPITKDNKLIMVRQWRYPIEEESLEIPAGGLEDKENPQAAAQRELREEVGGKSNNWHFLGSHWLGNGAIKMKGSIFLAQDVQIGKSSTEETEILKVELCDLGKVYKMVIDNEISDYRTKLGVLLAKEYLEKTI